MKLDRGPERSGFGRSCTRITTILPATGHAGGMWEIEPDHVEIFDPPRYRAVDIIAVRLRSCRFELWKSGMFLGA